MHKQIQENITSLSKLTEQGEELLSWIFSHIEGFEAGKIQILKDDLNELKETTSIFELLSGITFRFRDCVKDACKKQHNYVKRGVGKKETRNKAKIEVITKYPQKLMSFFENSRLLLAFIAEDNRKLIRTQLADFIRPIMRTERLLKESKKRKTKRRSEQKIEEELERDLGEYSREYLEEIFLEKLRIKLK